MLLLLEAAGAGAGDGDGAAAGAAARRRRRGVAGDADRGRLLLGMVIVFQVFFLEVFICNLLRIE